MEANSSRPDAADKPQSLRKPDERFQPKWPRSVSGKNYRTPFRFAEQEAISRRADRLYRFAPLADAERELLLRSHADLDGEAMFRHFDRKHSGGRDYGPDYGPDRTSKVARIVAFIEKLERKYFSRSTPASEGSDDDI
jgi:hypothetical protein